MLSQLSQMNSLDVYTLIYVGLFKLVGMFEEHKCVQYLFVLIEVCLCFIISHNLLTQMCTDFLPCFVCRASAAR